MFKKILLLDMDLQKCQEVPMQLLLTRRIISRPFWRVFFCLRGEKPSWGSYLFDGFQIYYKLKIIKQRALMFLVGGTKLEGGDLLANGCISRG